jgi:4-diphosphocytidyl-2-C-methyl-D-erythritol kinase
MNVDDIRQCRNDLTAAAMAVTPEIRTVLDAIGGTEHCLFQRLSGSGATCFGVYDSAQAATSAAVILKEKHPAWWVVPTQTI